MSGKRVRAVRRVINTATAAVSIVKGCATVRATRVVRFVLDGLDIRVVERGWPELDAAKQHRLVDVNRFGNLVIHTRHALVQ